MAVIRMNANIATDNTSLAQAFYGDVLDMNLVMDQGWIQMFAADGHAAPQISVASEGGSGTPVPDLSIEVDNFDEVYQRVCDSEFVVTYGPVDEPWGVRRFYVEDPFGRIVNILTHI